MRGRNVTKPFSIAGFILGEAYMLYTVLAPQHGALPAAIFFGPNVLIGIIPVPLSAPVDFQIWAVLSAALFFGPLGALVGLGVGLLVGAVLPKK